MWFHLFRFQKQARTTILFRGHAKVFQSRDKSKGLIISEPREWLPLHGRRDGAKEVLRCFKDSALFFFRRGSYFFSCSAGSCQILFCTMVHLQCKCLLRATDKHIGSHGSARTASSIAKRAALRGSLQRMPCFLWPGAEGSLSVQRASVFPRFDFLCQRLSVGSLLLNVSASFCLPLTRVSCGPSPFKK